MAGKIHNVEYGLPCPDAWANQPWLRAIWRAALELRADDQLPYGPSDKQRIEATANAMLEVVIAGYVANHGVPALPVAERRFERAAMAQIKRRP